MTETTAEFTQPSEVKKPRTLVDILNAHIIPMINPYVSVLRAESEDSKFSELGSYSQGKFNQHVRELEALMALLTDVNAQVPFETIVQQYKLLDQREHPRDTFSLSLARKGERIPNGPQNVQNQLRLHLNNEASGNESPNQALYALSVRGKDPHKVLSDYFKQSRAQSITVNSVGAYIDPETRITRIDPQAGISYSWRKGEDAARASGVVFVGYKPHFFELNGEMPLEDFSLFQKLVVGQVRSGPQRR